MTDIFSALESAELLRRVYPHGSHKQQIVKKPSKYLFSAPAFRAIYYRLTSNTISDENAKWKITEDLIAMYLYRIFEKKWPFSLTYDNEKWWADFILNTWDGNIIIEVGSGEKWFKWVKQVKQTSAKVQSKYSIVISESNLTNNQEQNVVHIPIRTFLLM